MALAETAAGKLPGLGDVLAGYKKILRALRIDSRLTLPGVWELGRSASAKCSPITWSDSGDLKVVRLVSGGTVDPGKVLTGLARAAENAGAQIVEYAEFRPIDFSNPLRLRVRCNRHGRHLHPALSSVRITHRWGGPILFTEKMRPVFRRHPRSKQVIVLAGYNGHGVALSVYLGKWAAEALLARRPLPRWY